MKKLTRIGEAEGIALAIELDELDNLNTDIDDLDSDDVAGFTGQDLRLIPVTSLSNPWVAIPTALRLPVL